MGGSSSKKKEEEQEEQAQDAADAVDSTKPPVEKVVKSDKEWRKELSSQEYAVLRKKATDRPLMTKSADEKQNPTIVRDDKENLTNRYPVQGYFMCRGCSNPLYSAESKFKSGCGWPAFDKCYKNSIVTKSDHSMGMSRVEILCAKCDGHLGHVFKGERMTKTNQRHCVNSSSIKYNRENPPNALMEDVLKQSDEMK